MFLIRSDHLTLFERNYSERGISASCVVTAVSLCLASYDMMKFVLPASGNLVSYSCAARRLPECSFFEKEQVVRCDSSLKSRLRMSLYRQRARIRDAGIITCFGHYIRNILLSFLIEAKQPEYRFGSLPKNPVSGKSHVK